MFSSVCVACHILINWFGEGGISMALAEEVALDIVTELHGTCAPAEVWLVRRRPRG